MLTNLKGNVMTDHIKEMLDRIKNNPRPKNPKKVLDLFIEFLKENKVSTRVLTDAHSYYYKHRSEDLSKYLEEQHGWQYEYCGNEEFIEAATNAGFISKRCSSERGVSPNFNFNIKKFRMEEVYEWVEGKL